jgi:hypothetical protein
MLMSTGRSPRGGNVSRPLAACSAKRAMVAMAARRETAQIGGRVASTTLFTGHVSPQASTTVIRARMPWRRELQATRSIRKPRAGLSANDRIGRLAGDGVKFDPASAWQDRRSRVVLAASDRAVKRREAMTPEDILASRPGAHPGQRRYWFDNGYVVVKGAI